VNLPNSITVGRIVLAALLPPLLFFDHPAVRLAGFVVFLTAAFSDILDGHLARRDNLVTDLGKLLDPLADKLLLVTTFVPLYLLAQRFEPESGFPWPGNTLPLWILIVIFGREIFITLFRSWAARRGVVIAAGKSGKYKTIFQFIFVGAAIAWYIARSAERAWGWQGATFEGFLVLARVVSTVGLAVAVVLSLYSMGVYLWQNRVLFGGRTDTRT
jgi:CDP-diacylglycerol---glycerol-3-phosphate 3-phosphatidyltransferase